MTAPPVNLLVGSAIERGEVDVSSAPEGLGWKYTAAPTKGPSFTLYIPVAAVASCFRLDHNTVTVCQQVADGNVLGA